MVVLPVQRFSVRARADRRRAWAAALAFLFPLLSLTTGFGIGLAGFLFLATALCWWRDCRAALRAHWPCIRWVALAFLLHFIYLAYMVAVHGRGANTLDAPLRMGLMLAALPVVLVARPPARALWLGAALGALGALAFVGWQRLVLGLDRPGGLLNPITFGDLSLCLALLSLAGAVEMLGATDAKDGGQRRRRQPGVWSAAVVWAGVLAGLAASLLTGSRGGWLVLPAVLAVLAWRRAILPRRLARGLPLLACLLAAVAAIAYALPRTGVRDRVAIGISDTRLYLAGNPAATSLSVRMELWKAGWMLVREHPWCGLDTPDYKRRMREWVAQGRISPAVFAPPEPPHMHNDVLQALVTRGVPGLLAWGGILLAPLTFFRSRLRAISEPGTRRAAALAGLLFVLAYAAFGLTEVIFWSMKASVFYALAVALLMGWSLSAADGPAPAASAAAAQDRPETAQAGPASHH